MRIRTFLNAQDENKFADLVDWRTEAQTGKSGQKKSSSTATSSRSSKKQKREGIVYHDEESE